MKKGVLLVLTVQSWNSGNSRQQKERLADQWKFLFLCDYIQKN